MALLFPIGQQAYFAEIDRMADDVMRLQAAAVGIVADEIVSAGQFASMTYLLQRTRV